MTGQHHHHDASESLLLRALPTSLPKVQVWKLPATSTAPRRVIIDGSSGSNQHHHWERYGFNVVDRVGAEDSDAASWQQEVHYTRWVPPLEQELSSQVEYDMDDADKEWLDSINADFWSNDGTISCEVFEILIDKLEKLWFSLQRHIPKHGSGSAANANSNNMPPEDSLCAVCHDGECEASNAIVFCDGCNLAVHQGEFRAPESLATLA